MKSSLSDKFRFSYLSELDSNHHSCQQVLSHSTGFLQDRARLAAFIEASTEKLASAHTPLSPTRALALSLYTDLVPTHCFPAGLLFT